MSVEKGVVSLRRNLGNLLGHITQINIGDALKSGQDSRIKEAEGFKKNMTLSGFTE